MLSKTPHTVVPSAVRGIQFFFIVVLVIGLFFRFINLDRKIYWYDEVFTSIRISGYTEDEIAQQAFNNQMVEHDFLQRFQEPASEKDLTDTVEGLIKEEPQLTPLYFILERFWTERVGGSVAATRLLSAIFSLLVFPGVYWLCLELFESSLVAWGALAFVAISPIQVLYAQEARMYSLWTAFVVLSSAALLKAMRTKTKLSWGIYALTLSLGLYTHLFTILAALGHGIYVAIIERFRLSKALVSYTLASTAGLLIFSPWIWILLQGRDQQQTRTSWASHDLGIFRLVRSWCADSSRIFIDFGIDRDSNPFLMLLMVPVSLALLLLVALSIYRLYRKAPRRVYLFALMMIALPPAVVDLKDALLGGQLSTEARYFLPDYVFAQIAVAYLVCQGLKTSRFWRWVTVTLVTLGVLSCTLSSQATSWWNKGEGHNRHSVEVANIVNQASHPVVVSSGSISTGYSFTGVILGLNHLLDSKVRLQLTVEPELPNLSALGSEYDLFLFMPSETLRQQLETDFEIQSAMPVEDTWLWTLKRRSS